MQIYIGLWRTRRLLLLPPRRGWGQPRLLPATEVLSLPQGWRYCLFISWSPRPILPFWGASLRRRLKNCPWRRSGRIPDAPILPTASLFFSSLIATFFLKKKRLCHKESFAGSQCALLRLTPSGDRSCSS